MPGLNATKWDDKAHADLLLAMVSEVKFSKEQWAKILEKVHAKGYNYTADAVTQHLGKLAKKEGKGTNGAANEGESSAGTKGKRTAKAAKPATAAPKRKRAAPKKKAAVKDEDEDELDEPMEDDDSPPAKRIKRPATDDEDEDGSEDEA